MKHCFGRAFFAGVAVAIAIAAISAPALAQDTFYKEMTIDGRLYVFASEPALRAYEASKELAVGTITRPGYGPNGETVVFDGPRAIELYNKKYNKTEAPPKEVVIADVKLPFDIKYRMPGLRLTFPKFEMNWVNRMQIRYTYDDLDTANRQGNRGSFRIRRFRSKWDGWIYTPNLTYELQVDWVGAGIADTTVGFQAGNLQDANLQYDFTNGCKCFMLKAGQFKAPFGRQELTSSGNQQFVDRSIASVLFAPARQLGLQIGGQFGTSQVPDILTYAGGVFNGNGINRPANENDKYEYTGRVMFSPFGNVGYSESNLEHYAFRVSMAVDYNNNNNFIIAPDGVITGVDNTGEWGTDIAIKALGGLFLYGEYYWRNLETPAGVNTRQTGATAQASWLFGDHFEIAGRYSFTDLNKNRDDRNIEEWAAGLSWYFNKHFWKLQADYTWLKNEGTNNSEGVPPARNKAFKIQAQLMF
ncbi:MAG: porin [Thermoanaerobaculia bacterium]